MNSKTKRANNQVNSVMNIQEQREMVEKANRILSEMRSFTWRDLETQGKFSKNEKLSFISDDMLIVGCDIGSETHYVRAIDTRGRELSKKALAFENDAEGFQKARDWAVQLAAANDKKQIVLGLEPTGHYWFCLAAWMVSNGSHCIHGVSESDGAWWSRCRAEEAGNLWSKLPVSDLCKAGSNKSRCWMSPISIHFV